MHGADPHQVTDHPEMGAIPFVLMRGGTSKAPFLRGRDLPPPGAARDRFVLRLFGSPDPRQIDGLGGADLLTSKLAIIDPPSRDDADLDYTFAQVSITEPVVDYDINCGNISAAVGAYAVDEGLVPATEPTTTVRIHNTNTGTILVAYVPVVAGRAAVTGDLVIDGVPGSGAPIALDYSATAGGVTGSLLPTGTSRDLLDTAIGPVEATIVDLANLSVFFPAATAGMTGTEGPGDLTAEHVTAAEAIKAAAAKVVGIDGDGLIPVPVAVAPPTPYRTISGAQITDADLCARVIGGRPSTLHKAYPGTVSATTAVASGLIGSVVAEAVGGVRSGRLRIGHPSGIMEASARVPDGRQIVEEATYLRTARRLAEGVAYVVG